MKSSQQYAGTHRRVWIALGMLTLLSACGTLQKRPEAIKPPLIACEERAPAEAVPQVNGASEDFRYWYAEWLKAMGIATAEVEKRVTTADCLDSLRKDGVIR